MKTMFIGEGLNGKINSPNTNVLNVLRALVEDKESEVYIPSDYKKGSTWFSSGDPRVHFLPSACGKKIKIYGIQSNEERFNFSLNGIADVIVEFPREDGTVELKNKKVFRNYTVIRDGKLAMDYVSAKLSKNSFEKLREIGILYYDKTKVPFTHDFKPDYVYKVDLTTIPLISVNWAQPAHIGLYDLMLDEQEIIRWIKFGKEFLKENPEDIPPSDDGFYFEQIPSHQKKSEEETEKVECIQYTIVNPSESKEISDDSIRMFFKELSKYENVSDYIRNLNKNLKDLRFKKRCVVYAIEMSKNKGSYKWSEWFKVPRSKNKMRQEAPITINDIECTLQRTVYEKEV